MAFFKKRMSMTDITLLLDKDLDEAYETIDKYSYQYERLETMYNQMNDQYNNSELENNKLKSNIENLKEDRQILLQEGRIDKQRIFDLEEEINKRDPGWKRSADRSWRVNPVTHDIESYKTPKDFDEKKVRNLEFYDNHTMCKFEHYDVTYPDRDGKWQEYDIPKSLYKSLIGEIQPNQYETQYIEKVEDAKYDLESKGYNIKNMSYFKSSMQFLLNIREELFTTKEFIGGGGFNNRESARKYLIFYQECNYIKMIKRGVFKVIF